MKLERPDKIVLISSLLLVSMLSTGLYLHLTKKIQRGSDSESIGKLSFKRFQVLRKYEERVVWEDIDKNEDVYSKDSILTKESSDAKLTLNNGVEFELSPNSMIIVENYDDTAALKIKSGRVKTTGVKGEKAYLMTDKGEAFDVGEADASVAVTENGDTEVSVKKGSVRFIDESGKEERVKKGEKLTTDKNKKKKIVKIEILLKKPKDSRVVLTSTAQTSLTFTWKAPKGYSGGNFVLADNPSFKNRKTIAVGKTVSRIVPLEPGSWYWKVTGKNGKKKFISETRMVQVVRIQEPDLIVPSQNAIIDFHGKSPKTQFTWKISKKCGSSTLIVSDKADLNGEFKEKFTVDARSFSASFPGAGTYYWSVRCKFPNGIQAAQMVKYPVHTFQLKKRKNAASPKIITKKGEIFHEVSIKREKAFLRWKVVPGAGHYRVTIYSNPGKKTSVFSKVTDKTSLPVSKKLKAGKYYWSVVSVFSKSSSSEASKPRLFEVKMIDSLELKRPGNHYIFESAVSEKSLRFAWFDLGEGFSYEFILSSSSKLKKPIITRRLQKSNFKLERKIPYGKYYWRVKAFYKGSDKPKVKSKIISVYYVRKALSSPIKLTPAQDSVVQLVEDGKIQFSWAEVSSANYYTISVYSIRNKKKILIKKASVKKLSYKLKSNEKLKPGNIYWSVVAEKRKNKETVQISPAANSQFELK
ncbi:MAG: FecR domain-containing protein [Leptospirales bacterium]